MTDRKVNFCVDFFFPKTTQQLKITLCVLFKLLYSFSFSLVDFFPPVTCAAYEVFRQNLMQKPGSYAMNTVKNRLIGKEHKSSGTTGNVNVKNHTREDNKNKKEVPTIQQKQQQSRCTEHPSRLMEGWADLRGLCLS